MKRGILASREELTALKNCISQRPYDTIYERLNRRCSLILETAPVTEAQWRSLWQQGVWGAAQLAARTTQGRILDLLIAHHIDYNAAYRSRAIEELKNLISWTTWLDPWHSQAQASSAGKKTPKGPKLPADLCTAEAAVAATVALDWLWEDLTEADRLRTLQAIHSKAIQPYRQGVQQQVFWYNAYSNWNAVMNSGCGLAALALSDDEPDCQEACNWARQGLQRFFQALGREGGWDEGTGYWGLGMRYLLLFGEGLSRLLDDQTILHRRGMDATGLFPIYFSPNGQVASFGDNPSMPLYGTLYLLVKHFGLKELTWWLDSYSFHRDVSTSGWSAAGLALLFRPIDADSPEVPDLQPLKVYHEIGWAAMADNWPRPGLYVAAKTGDLAASHSQRDMNSIQMQVDGEMLLVDHAHGSAGSQYSSQSPEEFYEVQARAHNTIVVAERDHRIDAQGSIVEAQSTKSYRWLAMDSAGACGEDVQFVRHLVMIVRPAKQLGEMLLVLDELDNGVPERVDLFWHTLGKIDLDSKKRTGVITGRQAAVRFALASTTPATVTQEAHRLSSRRTDHVLRLSCGVVGRAYFASVFTRRPGEDQLELEETDGGVEVKFGRLIVHFKPGKRHLELGKIKQK